MGISLLSRYAVQILIVLFAMFFTPSMLFCCFTSMGFYDFSSFQVTSSFHFLVLSYCGAQIFEIYGLGKEVVALSFCGSVSSIGGLTLDEVRNIAKGSCWSQFLGFIWWNFHSQEKQGIIHSVRFKIEIIEIKLL